jgi:hypothetical protein
MREIRSRAEIRCACGRILRVSAAACGKEIHCPACQRLLKVVWARDPATGRQRVVAIPEASPHLAKTPPPFKPHPGKLEVVCSCGQPLLASPHQANKKVRCPICGKSLTFETYRDPETGTTRIRKKPPGPSEPPKPTARRSTWTPSEVLLCNCGSRLKVTARHLGKEAECPACGTRMKLDHIRDPQTSLIQVRPRVLEKTAPPKPAAQDEWSLDDFPVA